MAFRKSKTDRRNFSDIYAIKSEEKFGSARYIKKTKICFGCKKRFGYTHNRQIYCPMCLKKEK